MQRQKIRSGVGSQYKHLTSTTGEAGDKEKNNRSDTQQSQLTEMSLSLSLSLLPLSLPLYLSLFFKPHLVEYLLLTDSR